MARVDDVVVIIHVQLTVVSALQAVSCCPDESLLDALRNIGVPPVALLASSAHARTMAAQRSLSTLGQLMLPGAAVQGWLRWMMHHNQAPASGVQIELTRQPAATVGAIVHDKASDLGDLVDTKSRQLAASLQSKRASAQPKGAAPSVLTQPPAAPKHTTAAAPAARKLLTIPECLDILGERIAEYKAVFDKHASAVTSMLSALGLRSAFEDLALPLLDAQRVSNILKRHTNGVAFGLFLQLATQQYQQSLSNTRPQAATASVPAPQSVLVKRSPTKGILKSTSPVAAAKAASGTIAAPLAVSQGLSSASPGTPVEATVPMSDVKADAAPSAAPAEGRALTPPITITTAATEDLPTTETPLVLTTVTATVEPAAVKPSEAATPAEMKVCVWFSCMCLRVVVVRAVKCDCASVAHTERCASEACTAASRHSCDGQVPWQREVVPW